MCYRGESQIMGFKIFGINQNNYNNFYKPITANNQSKKPDNNDYLNCDGIYKFNANQQGGITRVDGSPINQAFNPNSNNQNISIWASEINGKPFTFVGKKINEDKNTTNKPPSKPDDNLWSYFEESANLLGIDNGLMKKVKNTSSLLNNDSATGKRFSDFA